MKPTGALLKFCAVGGRNAFHKFQWLTVARYHVACYCQSKAIAHCLRSVVLLISNIDTIQYYILKCIFTLLSAIPRSTISFVAKPLAYIWYCLDRRHRAIAQKNFHHALGKELNNAAIKKLVRSNFVQLTRLALEIPSLLRFNKKTAHTYVTISGREHLQKARQTGKGIIYLTAHLGNWELMALASSVVFHTSIGVVARKLDHKPLDCLLTEIRTRTGNQVIDKDKGAAPIGRMLKEQMPVGILLDQNASWYDGVYVPFFGKTACTNKGLAMIALRHDAIVLPAFNIRQKDGRYQVIISPPVNLIRTGNLRKDVLMNTAKFNQIIEKHIRLAPDNWLWVHRRWRQKAIPESAKEKILTLTLHPDKGKCTPTI
jgi:Kdo2-lipid IVA lauroyltransferase/acyltransferase